MIRKYTFLKIDIVDHSKLVESEDPYQIYQLLEKFYLFVEQTTKKFGGKVWNWSGDGGLCAFPVGPNFKEAKRGIEAALEILREISPLYIPNTPDTPELLPEAKTKFKIRIATHLGDAPYTKSNFGRLHSPDLNLVAHLERIATPNSIVTTEKLLNCCSEEIKKRFTEATPPTFKNQLIYICESYGLKRLQTWEKVLQGIGILVRAVHTEGFKPDLVIGCTRSGSIVGAMLAGNLGQTNFICLNRKVKRNKNKRKIVFDNVAILNNQKVLPRESKILMCFYQIQSGETQRAFYSYLKKEGFKNILIATLFLDSRGKKELDIAGVSYVSAYDNSVPKWEDTPWKLNDAWEWI